MAEHMRSSQNKSNKFYGVVLNSGKAGVRIKNISLPDLGERYFTLRKQDFPSNGVLSVFSGSVPVLSEDNILFPQQPVMAVFGPDNESVAMQAKNIQFEYESLDDGQNHFNFEDGFTDSLIIGSRSENTGNMREIKTKFRTKAASYTSSTIISCEAWQEGDKMHIEVPTQWPQLIRVNVAQLLSLDASNVIVHQMPCNPLHNEYLICPAVLAYIAAMGTIRAGVPVVLSGNACSDSPLLSVERTTWCTEDGKPVYEECTMEAELGAFQIEDKEYIRQALAGLIPNYTLSYFNASVTTKRSASRPSLFYSGCGYADALFTSEAHLSHIASAFEIPVPQWKEYVSRDGKRSFTDYLPSVQLSPLVELERDIVEKSDFNRKWSSYETQHNDYSVIPFNRGVGIACGISVAGFSTTLARQVSSQAKITLTEKQNVTLLTSFMEDNGFESTVKNIISGEVDLGSDGEVMVLDNDGVLIDSGPDMLSRNRASFLSQLAGACSKLNIQRKEEKPPISLYFACDDNLMPCEFDQRGRAAVIIEIRVDNISFIPVATGAWVSVDIGRLDNRKNIEAEVRSTITRTLSECGALLSTESERPFSISFSVHETIAEYSSALTQAVDALTRAAFLSALNQCVPAIEEGLPVSPSDIQKALNEKEAAGEN